MNDASHDYVRSQFSGPRVVVPFDAPPPGVLKCPKCGTEREFQDDIPYEEQAECVQEDCIGQCFCLKWPHWANYQEAAQ